MKKLKFIVTIIIMFLLLQIVTIEHQDDLSNQINYKSISIQNTNLNFNDYTNLLKQISDNNDIVMVSAHKISDKTNWYCIGNKCNLKSNEYYSTINDSNAKAVLPIKTYANPHVESFDKLKYISTSNMAFTLVGDESNIEGAIKDLKSSSLSMQQNQSGDGATISKTPEILIYVFALSLIWITILTFQSKQYILEKYNGLYISESIRPIIKDTILPLIISTILSLAIISVQINNRLIYHHLLDHLLTSALLIIIVFIWIELFICFWSRKKLLKQANTSNAHLLFLRFVILIVIMSSISNVAIAGHSIFYSLNKINSLPPSQYDNYYTYGLGMPGAFDFEFADEVIDVGNVEFYKATEDKFNGIVTSFNDLNGGMNVVNNNYLESINRNIPLDKNFINVLVRDNSYDDTNLPDYVKLVHVDNDTYPYLDWETGLVNYYTGPVIVINSTVISQLDNLNPTLISLFLQCNNYFLTGNITEIEQVRHELGMDDYLVGFYNVSSISSDFSKMMYKRLFVNGLALVITTISIISFIFIYLKLNFELHKKNYSIEYYNGVNIHTKFIKSSISWILPAGIVIFINLSISFLIYFLLLLITCLLINKHYYAKQLKNNTQYIRE